MLKNFRCEKRDRKREKGERKKEADLTLERLTPNPERKHQDESSNGT